MNNIDEAIRILEVSKELNVNDNIIFDNDYGVYNLIKIASVSKDDDLIAKAYYENEAEIDKLYSGPVIWSKKDRLILALEIALTMCVIGLILLAIRTLGCN